MAICGLVITLSQQPDERELALAALAEAEDVTLGEAHCARLPAVLETAGGKADYRGRWEELERLPGVTHLDLTYVNFEE